MRLGIITGVSRGLGAALFHGLVRKGYHVIEFSRSAPHQTSIAVDLSQPDTLRTTIAASLKEICPNEWEEILVINNAATLDPIGPTSKKAADRVLANINTNFASPILALSLIVAHFQEARCRKVIASISSGAARKSYYGWSLYCAAKAGIEAYIEVLALEQQKEN